MNMGERIGESEMKLITLYVPEPYLKALDQLVNKRYYPHRAEAIRMAIRDMLIDEVWFGIGDYTDPNVVSARNAVEKEPPTRFNERTHMR